MKFYAVQKGKKPGIYNTWDECKEQVNGYSGAVYKSFNNKSDAEKFVKSSRYETSAKKHIGIDLSKYNCPIAFVDGSFNNDTKEYGYGVVIIKDPNNIKEIHFNGKNNNPNNVSMQNVAGEILASMTAMKYAYDNNLDTIVIFHDYEGISKWCTREWKANKEGTIKYRDFYDFISTKVTVNFVKVKGHSNEYYNDMVDALAKSALGIPLEKKEFESKIHPNIKES